MTTALVVDDSTVDRELVRSLLQQSSSLTVEFADDGADALRRISEQPPELVITDLHMPNLNGLQLVEKIRIEYPTVPVVLITGAGSERLAVAALKRGAVSYVPKNQLANELIPTVMYVLGLARADRSMRAVQECWQETQCTFHIPNDYNLIAPLVKQILEVTAQMQLLDETARVQLAAALEEALSNAMYHGNLELTAEQIHSVGYDLSDPNQANIIDERRAAAPYKDRTVHIDAKLNRGQCQFTIRDDGPGFEHSNLPNPTEVVATGTTSGRGLAKMRLFTDKLEFNAAGNQVTLWKTSDTTS